MLKRILAVIGVMLTMTTAGLADEVREFTLDNGLKVLLKENHNAPVVNFNVVYRVGSKFERPGITGISHLLEHMMFKTTSTLPLGEFDRRLKEVGADNNAYTWLDQTVYYELIAADKVDVALELEADRMRNLLCLDIDHELEMPVVRNELEQRNDAPFTLLYEELISTAFKAHPYQVPTVGWVDDVEGISAADIKDYYNLYYHPDNAFIACVGDFETNDMLAKIEHHFGGHPRGDVVLPRLPKEPQQRGERRFELRRAGQMDFVMSGWHIPESEHPDAYALEVLGNILGQGRTSRMYQALVDTGRCASAQAWSSAFGYADPFLFFTALVVSPGEEPLDVEPLMYEEIQKIIDGGVTDVELARAIKQAQTSFVYERDSIVSEARSLIDFELMSSWREIDKYLPGIQGVTSADIQRVASQYLTKDNRNVGIYRAIRPESEKMGGGPSGEIEQPARSLSQPPYVYRSEPGSNAAGSAVDLTGDNGFAHVEVLDNGITVVVKENHNNPTVNIHGLIRAGKIDDPLDKPGVGSFAVNMLSSGTHDHSKLELAEIMESAGIEFGISPSREFYTFAGRSLSEDFDLLMDTAAEQLLWPAFPEEEVEKTRQQILAGLLGDLNDTFQVGFYAGRDLIYGAENQFAGRTDGSPESVQSISRDDLEAWFERNSNPEGAVITIVGDISVEDAVSAVRKRFSNWRSSAEGRAGELASGAKFNEIGGLREVREIPDKSNASLVWIGPGVSKATSDWPQYLVAGFIFGGDFYSRLNARLRVKEGLTYGAFAFFSNGLASGPYAISVQVNPENIEPAIAATVEELQNFSANGITEEELQQAKDYLTGNFPVKLSTNGSVAAALTDAVYLGKGPEYIVNYRNLINSVTVDEVNQVASAYMDAENLALIIAGSVEE